MTVHELPELDPIPVVIELVDAVNRVTSETKSVLNLETRDDDESL